MTSRGLFFVCLAQLFVLQHQQQAVNEVIMLTPPGMNYFPEQWLAGVRLAEGGVVYISNRIELAVVNNDIYTFQSNNLYYYDMTVSVFLTYLIPGHTPQAVVAVGDQVWVTTDNCVLALNLSAAAHIVLGNCYEPNMMRDGPPLFARFTQIQAIVGIPALRLTLVLDAGTRLCQLQREGWVSSQLLPRTAQALAADSDPQEQIWWALAWEDGVSFGLWPALASTNATWQAGRSFRSLAFVFNAALPGVAYLYTVESKAVQRLMLNATSVLQSTTLFSAAGGADLTAISLDIPYGVYVLDSAKTGFSRIKNLGCLCPPGYAVLDVETDHCQPAPMGGYVDVMGNFIPCPPGTYGVFAQATAEEACRPCPPHTISAEPQSAFCMPCAPGQVQNPERTACVSWCPNGTVASNGGCVPMCPKAGYTFSSAKQGCVPCPPNTSRSVTDEDCRPCAVGTFSEQGSATCLPICSAGTYLPDNGASCVPWAQELSVFTIAVLGVHPVDMAVADNGTVYVAAFQVLILVDRSGSSTQIFLPEFGMVRSLALSWDQRVLYAAVNQDHVMCLSSLPMMLTKSSWVLVPGSITVGLRLTSSFAVVVWDAATNAIFQVKKKDGSIRLWVQGRPDAMIMAMHSLPTSDLVWVMLQDPVRGNQSILQLQPTSVAVVYQTLKESAWNPYMTTLWNQNSSLVLSSENMLLIPQQGVVGQRNGTGRVDSSTRQTARFTQPGPMVQAPNPNMLLVADQTSLRVVWWGNMRCASSFFDDGQHCAACPVGLSSMPGAQSCTPCTEGQYNDAVTGACVPCPRIRWWPAERSACSEFIDTMVAADAVGLSWQDIVSEAAGGVAMGTRDYVSLQTLILPLTKDAVLLNTAAQSRFWSRLQRVTPPPFMFNSLMQSRLPVLLPGFWVECSQYVLQSETCVCDLPAGGIVLGNTDMTQLWNRARADASLVDYSTLQIQIPPDPDLYVGGQTEAIYFVNMSVSLTSLFVSRTDAGGGTDDDNPSVFFLKTVSEPISIAVPPPTVPTPSESSFSACVAGWPATYLCPPGFVWVPSVFVCMPCKAGYYFDSPEQHCKPCSVGSYNPSLGSTACLACDLARITGASRCNSSSSSSSVQPSLTCGPGNEVRGGRCLPCLPGFASSMGQGVVCSACPPGKYANAAGRTACSPCTRPLVSAQWASSGCMACTAGYVASAQGDACQACIAGQQYFFNTRPYPSCVNKTVLKCGSGYYLQDGGPMSDNVCVACAPCAEGQVMLPFDANPCSYKETSVLGPPYRCVPVMSVAGQFSSLSLLLQSSTFTVQYTPCQGLPPFAWWSVGPEPSMCFFQCLYAIAGPIARQYLFYYGMEKPDAVTQHMLGRLPSNVFPLDYPGLGVGLMLMAQKVLFFGSFCLVHRP